MYYVVLIWNMYFSSDLIPYCLVVRIPGSHPGGPGSIPGMGKEELENFASFGHFCQIHLANSFCVSRTIAIGLTYIHTSQNLSSTLDILSTSACFHRDPFRKWFLCKKYRQGIRNYIYVNYSCVNEKEMNNYILPKE